MAKLIRKGFIVAQDEYSEFPTPFLLQVREQDVLPDDEDYRLPIRLDIGMYTHTSGASSYAVTRDYIGNTVEKTTAGGSVSCGNRLMEVYFTIPLSAFIGIPTGYSSYTRSGFFPSDVNEQYNNYTYLASDGYKSSNSMLLANQPLQTPLFFNHDSNGNIIIPSSATSGIYTDPGCLTAASTNANTIFFRRLATSTESQAQYDKNESEYGWWEYGTVKYLNNAGNQVTHTGWRRLTTSTSWMCLFSLKQYTQLNISHVFEEEAYIYSPYSTETQEISQNTEVSIHHVIKKYDEFDTNAESLFYITIDPIANISLTPEIYGNQGEANIKGYLNKNILSGVDAHTTVSIYQEMFVKGRVLLTVRG